MRPIYLGVDVAGAKNTWVAGVAPSDGGISVVCEPYSTSLQTIVDYCEQNDVVAVAIDAQLAIAISDENGFRSSDTCLQNMLPEDCEHWVMSFNALMAVPVRGRLLADHLSPTVGTLIETHPRACLLFGLGHCEEAKYCEDSIRTAIREYKPKSSDTKEQKETRKPYTEKLWRLWSERFSIHYQGSVREDSVSDDGALDALVCATIAHQFHQEPSVLRKLQHDALGKTGRGPFYVLDRTS